MTPARRHGAVVLALWAVALLLALVAILRVPFVADMSAFLPAKPDARQQLLIEQLQSGAAARTLLVGIAGGDSAQRAAASKTLAAALRGSGRFEQVQNGETAGFAAIGQWLFENRYALSPAVSADRFTAAGLADGIADTLSLLGTPAGAAIKPLLERDPTGETLRIGESLLPAAGPRSADGVWMSRPERGRGERALLLAITRAAGADLDGQAAALATLREAFAALPEAGVLTLELSGAPLFSVESRARIETEAHRLGAFAAVLVSLLLWWVLRSWSGLAVALLPVASGVLVGIAAVALGFGSVHGLTLGFGATLIGEAVDYAIYYLIQARRHARDAPHERGWQRWLRTSWPTVRLGLLTSLAGFAALVFSGFPGLAQLGVFSCAGLLGAALTTRHVLPVLRPDGVAVSERAARPRQRLGRLAARLFASLPTWRRAIVALGIVAAAGLVWQHDRLWRADLLSLSPIDAETLKLDAELRAELMPGEGGLLVVVQGPDLETVLQRAEAADARLQGLVDAGQLAGVSSVTRWLPSQAQQDQRRNGLPEAVALRTALAAATAGGPLPASRLQPFVDEVQAARTRPPLTREVLAASPAATLVDALLLERPGGGLAALMPVQPIAHTAQALARVEASLAGLEGAVLLDIKPELDRLYQRYLDEAKAQTLMGATAVLVLVMLWLRSWRRLLAVCQPLVLAVLFTLAGLALAQVALGILHLVGLLLVVAVGSNYALFFDMLHHDRTNAGIAGPADAEEANDTLASLALANLTTVASFGLIAMSEIPALSAIGRVVAPGALLALLLAAAFAGRPAATPLSR